MNIRVFVYGTLKPGEGNYQRYCEGNVIQTQPAIAPGILYALPLGYPAMTVGSGWVQGAILSFSDPEQLQILDALEDYDPQRSPNQNDYERCRIAAFDSHFRPLGTTWVYMMQLARISALGGDLLPSGEWTG
jgi:gamma-glutamylcyclotransferase (GGCT)/AIG2-like uncharacterized protein YtfP